VSDRELLDAAGDHAPDLDGLAFLGRDVWVGRVGGLEFDATGPLVQLLDGKVPIDDGHHNVVVARLDGLVHHQDVIVKDADFDHGVPAGPQEVGGLCVLDQQLREVDPLSAEILRRRRKSCLNISAQEQCFDWKVRCQNRFIKINAKTVHSYSILAERVKTMCSHYQGLKEQEKYRRYFGVEPPHEPGKHDLWPGYVGAFILKHPQADVGDEAVPEAEAHNGLFGLVPHWATDAKITKSTYNCRSETAASKPSFREAYKRNQRCIIPADAFFEPDWRTGKAIATRIESNTAEPLGIAGLWSSWKSPDGTWLYSYTMLTLNADAHPLMNQFHKRTDEKRMVAILQADRYTDWLSAKTDIMSFMMPYAGVGLQAISPQTATQTSFA
jgi:putative SOS response-associated peptidase YedK